MRLGLIFRFKLFSTCVWHQNMARGDASSSLTASAPFPSELLCTVMVLFTSLAHVGPGECYYQIGPISFLAGWCKSDLNQGQFGFVRFSCLGLLCCVLLSALLYVSKRGAYCDRLCRDIVGRWLVGRWLSRACTVAKRCILGLQLLWNTNRKPYPRNSMVQLSTPWGDP